jgi:hypothetical protein
MGLLLQSADKTARKGSKVAIVECENARCILWSSRSQCMCTLWLRQGRSTVNLVDGLIKHIAVAKAMIKVGNAIQQEQGQAVCACA